VRAPGNEAAEPDAVAVERLGARVLPQRHIPQSGEVRSQKVVDADLGSFQRHTPEQQHNQQGVGVGRAEVDELQPKENKF